MAKGSFGVTCEPKSLLAVADFCESGGENLVTYHQPPTAIAKMNTMLKNELLDFFVRLFNAYKLGKLNIYDGDEAIKFKTIPTVLKEESWDLRQFPVVLIGNARGEPQMMAINKDFMDYDENNKPVHGSYIETRIPVGCVGQTKDESNDIADFLLFNLLRPDAKQYLFPRLIDLPGPPTIDGEAVITSDTGEFGLYRTDFTVPINFHWYESMTELETLIDILAEPTMVADLSK